MSARTLDQLRKDLREFARLAEVRYDPAIADPVLETLAELWTNSVVGVRTTTHPVREREVDARVMHPGGPTELIEKLRGAGLLGGLAGLHRGDDLFLCRRDGLLPGGQLVAPNFIGRQFVLLC